MEQQEDGVWEAQMTVRFNDMADMQFDVSKNMGSNHYPPQSKAPNNQIKEKTTPCWGTNSIEPGYWLMQ